MLRRLTASLIPLLLAGSAAATIRVTDDAGQTVSMEKPAQRVISLAPHITELLFEAGAGKQVIAVSDYSDYPAAAKQLPSVGNVFALDTERLLAMRPDLVIVWGTGKGHALADQLRANNIRIFESDPKNYEQVASSLERLGELTGNAATGQQAAKRFRDRLQQLQSRYQLKAGEAVVTVFYQVWHQPLMTLSDQHLVSSAIRLCGGKNLLGAQQDISPKVGTEAVIAANPDAILTGGESTAQLEQFWQHYQTMSAVKNRQFYAIKGDWLNRNGPRVLDGTEALCQVLQKVRAQKSRR